MKPSVLICTPSKSGYVHLNYLASLMGTFRILEHFGFRVGLHLDQGKTLDMGRSLAATYFLNSDFTHMMFIDDDMVWQPELVARMIEFGVDIIGVPYRQKVKEVIYNMRSVGDFEQSTENPSLLSVNDIATGLLLIRKNVLEKMKDTVEKVIDHPSTKQTVYMFFRHQVVQDKVACPDGELTYMSEDLYFCRMARELGFQIWAYVDAETAHTGTISFKGNYADVLEGITPTKFRDDLKKSPLQVLGEVG
jgi:GT2 family glycosyltransferase